jgi:5S rRNA maturation endonuclease (ribonuclease M5)
MKKYYQLGTNEIEDYLSRRGFYIKKFSDDNLRLDRCPLCNHKQSFSINAQTGQFECWKTSCGKRGNWVTLRRMLNDPLDSDSKMINFKQDWKDFFQIQERGPVTRNKYPEVLDYLHDRGFSNETLDAFRVSNKYNNAVRFPIYAWNDGQWDMVNARIIQVIGEKKNYFDIKGGPTHLLLGNHLMHDVPEKVVYIFEGQWDMLTAYELGIKNVFSLPNGASSVKEEMFQYIPLDWDIVICVDMDESGNACAQKFFDLLKNRVSRIHLPHKDLNDWYKADPSLTKEMVLDRRTHLILPRKREYRKIRRNISEEDKQKPIVNTPFKGLDTLMGGGFFPAQMTSVLAASGAGKTTFVNQVAVYCANQKIKIGLICLEGSEQELDEKIDRTITGMVGEESDENIVSNLLISTLRGKHVTHAQIIEECSIMAYEDKCQIIIVDNLDFITSGIDPKKYETTAALMDLVDKCRIHLIQIWQCNKHDSSQRVNSSTQKGESRIFQDSHNYINLNSSPDGDQKILEMEKNREVGRGTFELKLVYDRNTNSYCETSQKSHNLSIINLQ